MIENQKCGSLPNHINSERNWGYGYNDLMSDLSEWSQSPYVVIDSIGRPFREEVFGN